MLSFQIYKSRSNSGLCLDLTSRPCTKSILHISTNLVRTLSARAVAVFLMTLQNSKLFLSPIILYIICVFLKTSISLSISHAVSMFSNKIAFSSISLLFKFNSTHPISITSNPLSVRRHVMLKLDITGHLMPMSLNSRPKILKTN